MFKKSALSVAVASALVLAGCGSNDSSSANAGATNVIEVAPGSEADGIINGLADTQPIFNPGTSQVPVPNDFIIDQLAADGTYSDPAVPETANPVQIALGGLSGSSLIAPIDIPFNGALNWNGDTTIDLGEPDARSVILNGATPIPNPTQNVFVLELDYASGEPIQGLSAGETPTIPLALTFAAASAGSAAAGAALAAEAVNPSFEATVISQGGVPVLRIQPTKPLKPKTKYLVVVTNEVLDAAGDPVGPSLAYTNIKDTSIALPSTSLSALRSLVNNFWETVANTYFGLVTNNSRAALTLPNLSRDNIALSYSVTTTGDEKVMEYMANPAEWFNDQVTNFARLATIRVIITANAVLPDKTAINIGGTDAGTNASVDYFDYQAWADRSVAAFPATDADLATLITTLNASLPAESQVSYPDFATALSTLFAGPCNGATGTAAIGCVATVLSSAPSSAGGFADLLPTPADRSASATLTSSGVPVNLISAPVSTLITTAITPLVSQGTIDVPYYLGIPTDTDGSAIQNTEWVADTGLAIALNTAFAGAGLALPQGVDSDDAILASADGDAKSDRVNYIYPFPQQSDADPSTDAIDDLTIPWLALYPNDTGACPKPWRTVIFQHGITTDRSAALSVGTVLAQNCYATIAIDQPAHGVAPVSTQERLDLAATLLAVGQDNGLPASLAPSDTNNQAVVDGTLTNGFVQAAVPTDAATAAGLITSVLGGGTTGNAALDAAILALESFQNTVATAGSTIPGIAPTDDERHFNYTANAQLQAVPMVFDDDAAFGSSGSLFINLLGFLNSRDKNRQSTMDILNLRQSIAGLDIDGVAGADLDDTAVFFMGHSLGTVAGTPAVAVANSTPVANFTAASLLTPASGIARMLENSPSFAPTVVGGLAGAGIAQGTTSYETFISVLQSALDAVDPISFGDNLNQTRNYAFNGIPFDPSNSTFQTSADDTGVLIMELAGRPDVNGNPQLGFLSDQTNVIETETVQFGDAFQDLLSGTDELAVSMGAVNTLDSPAPAGSPDTVISRQSFGSHGMYVLPVLSAAETTQFGADADNEATRRTVSLLEGLTQSIAFFAANGEIEGGGAFVDTGLDTAAAAAAIPRATLCAVIGIPTDCSALETEANFDARTEIQLNLD